MIIVIITIQLFKIFYTSSHSINDRNTSSKEHSSRLNQSQHCSTLSTTLTTFISSFRIQTSTPFYLYFLIMLSFKFGNSFLPFYLNCNLNPLPYFFFRKFGVPVDIIYPKLISEILEHSTSASSIECVVIRTALLCLLLKIISQISRLCFRSSPVVGSSRTTRWGSPTRAMAIESLLFIPPLN